MPILARNIVSTSQPLAAQAGLRMMLKGGNAVDAALATAIALTVLEPTSNGIGSDAYAILWDGKELIGLNASGRSPAGWTPERFKGMDRMPVRGWDAVSVPGCVSAWVALSERYGKLPFADLFEPAITYARDGYLVSPTIARLWQKQAPDLQNVPGYRDAFMPRGRAPHAGEHFHFPDQARTLQTIAATRGEAYYRGELAEKMLAHSKANGGCMSKEDLASHRCDWVTPIAVDYHGFRLHEIPPNGQGIAALMMLGILENLDVGRYPVDSADFFHAQLEAMKLSFGDLYQYVADIDYMRVKPEQLLDRGYLAERAKCVDMKRAQQPGPGTPRTGGTVYLTAADAGGMMVSFIQSNFMGFGSGIVVPGTGISMQNRGYSFVTTPGHANQVGPRKRPFQTIIPGFVTQGGAPLMSFGVMGGSMQAQGHSQVLVRLADYRQNPQAAADAPRFRVEGGVVNVEQGMAPDVLDELRRRGHNVAVADRWSTDFGRAQLIHRIENGYVGASERRTDGQAVGF
jgi:gamma-glutamyltranspeptidase/glutathione hydrolase